MKFKVKIIIKIINIFFLAQIFSASTEASYLKLYHTGSTKESQTNTISGAYSPSTSDALLEASPWEVNASAGLSNSGSNSTQVITTSSELGASYKTKNKINVSLSVSHDVANNGGITSLRPSVGIDKKWIIGGSGNVDEDDEESDDESDFNPKIGVTVNGSQKNATQKKMKTGTKDMTVQQRLFDYGISFKPVRWLAIDFNTSRFSYDQSIEAADEVASSTSFTNQLGYSYTNLLENFNDKDDTIRLTFNLTSETSIELSASKSHGIVMQNWTTDYILQLSSTIFDSWGYSFGVTQSKSTDSIQETYSGDASLSHYF